MTYFMFVLQSHDVDPCLNIDTIFSTADGSYYVFKSADYWKMSEDSIQLKSGYPRKISDDWPGLPDNIDAAFMWPDNYKTYFFKG